eukprot:TRINITY_DN14338_c0_g1_i1.p1 TRINITY_DN14338_c0_g1~~TRINITY_DN14338_c0_g1_i1.p1  ORF type:complete len:570 (+),score=119.56 TRINITY_DN14338_c0_g1_i1:82-1791(+)
MTAASPGYGRPSMSPVATYRGSYVASPAGSFTIPASPAGAAAHTALPAQAIAAARLNSNVGTGSAASSPATYRTAASSPRASCSPAASPAMCPQFTSCKPAVLQRTATATPPTACSPSATPRTVPASTPCSFRSLQPGAQAFKPGETVEVRWGSFDSWLKATFSRDNGDGTCVVDWADGSQHGRIKNIENVRRPSLANPALRKLPAQASVAAPATTRRIISQATPQTLQSGGLSPKTGQAACAEGIAHGVQQVSLDSPQRQFRRVAAVPAAKAQSQNGSAATGSSPSASRCAPAQQVRQSQDGKAAPAAATQPAASEQNAGSPKENASVPSEAASGAEAAEQAETPQTADVKVFMVETKTGETAVMVERQDGKRWRFMRNSIDFELACTADALQAWLDGICTEQLPGLLTLLANEVNTRGESLKAAEKDRDALRGTEDYDFFGLDGNECSDKDIERAYRRKSTQLHPDKGGDEESFNQMREKYEQLKSLRGENKRKEGGGSIKWDPKSRDSMMTAHRDLREQLVWITRHIEQVEEELKDLRKRQSARHSLTWTTAQSVASESLIVPVAG